MCSSDVEGYSRSHLFMIDSVIWDNWNMARVLAARPRLLFRPVISDATSPIAFGGDRDTAKVCQLCE